MPKVTAKGKTKKFPYTAKGEVQAKQFAKKVSGKLSFKKNMKGRMKR